MFKYVQMYGNNFVIEHYWLSLNNQFFALLETVNVIIAIFKKKHLSTGMWSKDLMHITMINVKCEPLSQQLHLYNNHDNYLIFLNKML